MFDKTFDTTTRSAGIRRGPTTPRLRVRVAIALACLGLFGGFTLAAAPAFAAPIQFDFQATITGGDNSHGLLDGTGLTLGSTIAGFFVMDSLAVDVSASPRLGQYTNGITAVEVQLGTLRFVYTPPSRAASR